ncbi:MAG TPA: PhzF family phenazine biosynthesis protein [Polyangiaceae bacterium]|nr:PhzF family phenazine biosynthesis protein [Polyangiaceae bacterium]
MRALRYILCDVFTDRPLAGNQLAVFTDARGLDSGLMQSIAREMNLAETVFVQEPQAGGHARLRIFTPTRELPFAGHPTLGSAFVLGGPLQLERLELETGAGTVPVRLEREGPRVVFGWMEQPLPTWRAYDDAPKLLAALGLAASELPILEYDNGPRHVLVTAPDVDSVAALAPDLGGLASFLDGGVSVFTSRGPEVRTRMFAPAQGVPEDAATGSAAGPLAVHLAVHGRIAWGEPIRIEQGAEMGRPSELHAVAFGATDRLDRLEVGGAAVIIGRGELRI